MRKRIHKCLKIFGLVLLTLIVISLIRPTWTPPIEGENSISEFRMVEINHENIQVMIRGYDRENPVLIFVHGGPCCSEIPYIRKYQEELEKDFTIVHYDQRGSGKSYIFGKDYSDVTVATHVSDLIELTKYVEEYLEKEQVILLEHSFGTYIATIAASQEPDLYQAYIGIGQMSHPIEGELNSLKLCMEEALAKGNEKDINSLKQLEESILQGEKIVPRSYIRKYGFAARKINEAADYWFGFLLSPEYNLLDGIGLYFASWKYQDSLIMESINQPLTQRVTEINLPVYFVMGKYDGMTSPISAEEYLFNLGGDGTKEFVLFTDSAHYPQLEEKETFYQWMKNTFK